MGDGVLADPSGRKDVEKAEKGTRAMQRATSKRKRAGTAGTAEAAKETAKEKPAKKRTTKETTKEKPAKKRATKRTSKTQTSPPPPPPPARSSAEWPPFLRALETVHRALNVVFTICCTRKHLLTTFATMRAAVEAHMGGSGRALAEADVAAVAALLAGHFGGSGAPGTVQFGYVDERSLQVAVQGLERDEVFKTGSGRGGILAQAPPADASVGGVTGREEDGDDEDADADDDGGMRPQVLYFAFVDEGLRREVRDGQTGEATRPTRRLREERLRMPVYGQAQMAGLIARRDRRFAEAVNGFLDGCAAAGTTTDADVEAALRAAAAAFVPKRGEGEILDTGQDTNKDTEARFSSLPETIPAPEARPAIPDIVAALRAAPWYSGQIVAGGERTVAAREAQYGELEFLLSQDVVNALYNAKGITRFYAHQAAALNGLAAGRHVVVATPTSSGKSLVYQVPVVRALEEEDGQARALFVFPTKALAQDQLGSLRGLLAFMPGLGDAAELVATLDGDTPWAAREAVRERARVVLTNPDMLHATVLPRAGAAGGGQWQTFLQRLRLVVVDELHYYAGVLGAHVAYVLRRLRRACAAVGNGGVQFVACSATVADPGGHFRALVGLEEEEEVQVVTEDGGPAGPKTYLCWNTPFRVPGDPASGRGSALAECARLFCELVLRGVRVLAFCRVREQCEKLVGAVRRVLATDLQRPAAAARVMAYRGGYTAQQRRQIEADMFGGRLLGIVATSALELGVDMGALDCVLCWGFPYSLASLRQQMGRAGRRRGRDALAVLVGDGFAADQHYMQHPERLFTDAPATLALDLGNVLVRAAHVQCAAYERPVVVDDEDAGRLGMTTDELRDLCQEQLVPDDPDDPRAYHCHPRWQTPHPAALVQLRDADDDHYAVVDGGARPPVVLEEVEAARVPFTLYDGGIYLHQGQPYLVRDVRPEQRMARVERVQVDWTTQQRDYTDVDAVRTEGWREMGRRGNTAKAAKAYRGAIRVTTVVFGFFKMDRHDRILDAVQVDAPPLVRHSRGTWLDVPAAGLAVLQRRRLHVAAALHAAEHAVLSLLPGVVVSAPGDVRTECKSGHKEFSTRRGKSPAAPQRKRPARLIFYDARGGSGSGVAAKVFDVVDVLLAQALERVEGCVCGHGRWADGTPTTRGCLECVASTHCPEANTVLSKAGAVVVLRSLLGLAIDEARLPMGPEEGIPVGPETIVPARVVPGGGVRVEEEEEEEEEDEVKEEEDEVVVKDDDDDDDIKKETEAILQWEEHS